MTKVLQAATIASVLAPATAATTARTAAIDTTGADYASIIVNIGAEVNTNSTNVVVSISEGNDTNTFTTFDTNMSTITVDNASAAVAVRHIDLKGRKRYLKLTVTPDTTTNGAVITSANSLLLKDRAPSTEATNVVVG